MKLKKCLIWMFLLVFLVSSVFATPSVSDLDVFPNSPNLYSDIWGNWSFNAGTVANDKSSYYWYNDGVLIESGSMTDQIESFDTGANISFFGNVAVNLNETDFIEGNSSLQINSINIINKFDRVWSNSNYDEPTLNDFCILVKSNVTDADKLRVAFRNTSGAYSGGNIIPLTTSWNKVCQEMVVGGGGTGLGTFDSIYQVLFYPDWDDTSEDVKIWVDDLVLVYPDADNISFSGSKKFGDLIELEVTPKTWNETGLNVSSFEFVDINGSVDLLFSNLTNDYKTSFSEGENIFTYINFTDTYSGLPINDSRSDCEITFYDVIYEIESTFPPFSICNHASCDYEIYSEVFNITDKGVEVTDQIKLNICHENLQTGDVDIIFSCDSGDFTETISSFQYVDCLSGTSEIFVKNAGCINDDLVTVYVDGSELNNNQYKNISVLEFEREFSSINHSSVDNEVFYNSSSDLWYLDHYHEYYDHGSKNISVECVFNRISEFTSKSELITIENVPPVAFPFLVTNSLGSTSLSNWETETILIEYATGEWNWFGTILDNDPESLIIEILNNTGGSIYNFSTDDLSIIPIVSHNGSILDGFNNPYNFTIFVNDSYGDNTTISFLFNVTDTVAPSQNGLNDVFVDENTVFSWSAVLSDERLDNFSISCDNGFNFSVANIDSDSYSFVNSTLVNSTISCSWVIYDEGGLSTSGTQNLKPQIDKNKLTEFSSLPQASFYFFLYLLWFGVIVMWRNLKGKHGRRIGLLNIFQMIIAFVTGTGFWQFSFMIGFVTVFVGVLLFFGGMAYDV